MPTSDWFQPSPPRVGGFLPGEPVAVAPLAGGVVHADRDGQVTIRVGEKIGPGEVIVFGRISGTIVVIGGQDTDQEP